MSDIQIYLRYDGWLLVHGSRHYAWDHEEPDMGTEAIRVLLQDLGFSVDVVEDA